MDRLCYYCVYFAQESTATIIADAEAIEKSMRAFLEEVVAKAAVAAVAVVNTDVAKKTPKKTPAATAPAPAAPASAPKAAKAMKAVEPKLVLSLGKKVTPASSPSAGASSSSSAASATMQYATSGTIELGQNSTFVSIALRVIFMEALQEVKKHFMVNKFNSARIPTSGPFLKAVDPLKYPDYAAVVPNPMDLTMIEKKIANNRYTASLSTITAGKTTPLSSVLGLRSYSSSGAVDPSESTGVVSAGIEAIWAIRCDFELLRNNAHAYNTGTEGLEVRLMVDALYDIFNHTVLDLVTRVSQGSPLHCTSPLSQKWISGTSLATGSSSTRAEQAARYISVFHSLLYTFQAEHSLKVASKQPRKSDETECRDKDGNILTADDRLLRWMETAKSTPESVDTYFGVLQADRVEADRLERERRAALLLKRTSGGAKGVAHPEPMIVQEAVVPQLPPEPVLTIRAPKPNRKSGGGKSKSVSAHTASPDPIVGGAVGMDVALEPPGVALGLPEQAVRELESWENESLAIMKRICTHEYVAISKDITREKCICDFFYPVVLDASKATAAGSEPPLGLTALINMVESGGCVGHDGVVIPRVKDAEDFYRKLISIFSNPIKQNAGNTDLTSFGSKVANRARTVGRLCKWLCLEKLPLTDASKSSSSTGAVVLDLAEVSAEEADIWDPKSLKLTVVERDLHRRFRRDQFLKKFAPIPNETRYSKDCTKLLNALEKACTKLKRDKMVYSWLSVPVNGAIVPDYAMYVRKPMDIGTAKRKLEAYDYTSYHSFIEDLRLVFSNAIKYNSVHMESDLTGTSKEVVEKAAIGLTALDEILYPTFSVDVADRWGRADLLDSEARLKRQKAEELENKLLAEKAEFYATEQARLRLTDEKFAADLDVDRKRQDSKRALQDRADEEQEAQMLIASGLDEAVVESGAFKPWKYENVVGVITSDKQLSSMYADEPAKQSAAGSGGTLYFPGTQMLLPQAVSVPGAEGSSSSTVDESTVPSSISISGSGMYAVIRPNYTRTQELFMKYQVARHHVRQRAWEHWASRPGLQTGTSVDPVKTDSSTDEATGVAMDVQDVTGGDTPSAAETENERRRFVDVTDSVSTADVTSSDKKRKFASVMMKLKPTKQTNALKPRIQWAQE